MDVNISNNPADETPPAQPPQKTRKQRPAPEPEPADEPAGGITKYSDGENYAITLNGCTISDDRARCSFTISNNGKVRNFNMHIPTHTAEQGFEKLLRRPSTALRGARNLA